MTMRSLSHGLPTGPTPRHHHSLLTRFTERRRIMPGPNRTTHEKDREEDYRDFEQRDLGDGWPYADGEPVKRRNADYGETSDELDPKNTQISHEPFIESEGGPNLFPDEEHG